MSEETVDQRVPTGIPGLDRMLGGGLRAGRPFLVTGGTGSGKTLLGLTFLLEGVRRGEEVLLVAVDEPPSEIVENVRSLAWDLSSVKTLDANPGMRGIKRNMAVQEIRAMSDLKSMRDVAADSKKPSEAEDIAIQGIQLKLRQQMANVPFRRVLVDSITSIRRFAVKSSTDPQAERTEIQSLLRFLSEAEATTLITATPSDPGILTPEEVLTRGEILLTRKWVGDRSVRQIKIVRMRGTAHDPERRPFAITSQGIVLG
ncbi:MAG TPA: ATPase domain-containing protein [Thermoplasmata archaeon]|nr:ATPase domain-containing protein [Thermoplasmata archaeon]HYB77563.1 ATPase domain-containing protein [Thermoplasmata archaeon]